MREFVLSVSDGDTEPVSVVTGVNYSYLYIDPVVIDLDGDGVEIDEFYYETFDDTVIGVGKDDAVLVWDIDDDGTISHAVETNWVELSETATDDLQVLSELFDTNDDGVFDKHDKKWSEFALWQDKDMDGMVGDGEFVAIEDSQVSQINLQDIVDIDDETILSQTTTMLKDGSEVETVAAILGTTTTDDKLSNIDILTFKQASVLNEQLASISGYDTDYSDHIAIAENIDDDIHKENMIT